MDRSDLDYYTPRYDPDGPAMTDSVNSVIAAQLGDRLLGLDLHAAQPADPFVKAPYEQFTEARSGQGVFTFLTGEGGFLQEFLYGYTGLRWRADGLRLDPMLPPQLADGLRLAGLRWQGRTFDVVIKPETTTVTLRSGPAIPLDTPRVRTAHLDAEPADPLGGDHGQQPRPVPAGPGNAADPSLPRSRRSTAAPSPHGPAGTTRQAPSSLTVRLGDTASIGSARLTWLVARPLGTYSLQARSDEGWVTVANVRGSGSLIDRVRFDAVPADALRVRLPATRSGGLNPQLAELVVTR